MRILQLSKETKNNILEDLLKRSPNSYGAYEDRVAAIIDAVREKGDEAIFSYTKQFDGADINAENIIVTKEEIEERRNSEIRFGDEKLIPDLLQNDEIPYEKRTEINKLFRVFK